MLGGCSFMSSTRRAIRDFRDYVLRVKRLDREALASVYLSGSGIEIGALYDPLKIPLSAKVKYLDCASERELRKRYSELEFKNIVYVDILDNGEKLETIEDSSQDFIIANHFLEYCENPISAVANFVRVLKNNGVLFICVPDKRYSFDNDRKTTTFGHLLRDYEQGPICSKNDHFRDWVVFVERKENEDEIQQRMKELISESYSIHYHVWAEKDMLTFFEMLDKQSACQ